MEIVAKVSTSEMEEFADRLTELAMSLLATATRIRDLGRLQQEEEHGDEIKVGGTD